MEVYIILFLIIGGFGYAIYNGYQRNRKLDMQKNDFNQNHKIETSTKFEYKRCCKKCGRDWYVSPDQLRKLKSMKSNGTLAILMFDVSQGARNRDSAELEIMKLEHCPNCNSSDYLETQEKTY